MKTTPSPALMGALLLFVGACESVVSRPEKVAPERIQGVWVTDEPSYADRKLEILEESLLFYSEENVYQPFMIQGVELEELPEGTFYDIEHSGGEGGSLIFSVFLRRGDTTMVFRNQPLMVWRKMTSGG